jgi:hypothetical protein
MIHPNKEVATEALAKSGLTSTRIYTMIDEFDITGHNPWETKTQNIRTVVKNFGIYDKDETGDKCIQEHNLDGSLPLSQSAHNEWPSCKARVYVHAMDEFCACLPFTMRSLVKRPITNRFCTFEIYNSACFKNVTDHLSKTPCFDQCVSTKNYYRFDRYPIYMYPTPSMPSDLEPNNWYSQTRITVYIEDLAYSVFQQKFKFSIAQLISQIGGNIGIYTGFSMLALCQLFFFFMQHKKRNERKMKSVSSKNLPMETWFDAIMCYMETRGCKYDQNEETEKDNLKMELEKTKENFQKQLDGEHGEQLKLQNELQEVTVHIQKLMTKMNELKEKIKTLSKKLISNNGRHEKKSILLKL